MRFGRWARLLCAAIPFLGGCAGFWQNPNTSSANFTLTNSGNISVSPGSSGTSTITVKPANSFTGTVTLTCAVTTTPSGASSPATCSVYPTSLSITSTSAQTGTLTATTTSSTTGGAYDITVTGASGSASVTTTLCAEVSTTSATCSAPSSSGDVFYVLNQTTNQVVAMSIASGKVSTIGAATLSAPPLALAVAPNGGFLYVSTAGGIYVYTVGSNGALTLGNNSLAISSDPATAMQVDATNSWLVDAVSGSGQLAAIAINSSTGLLAASGETEQMFPGNLPFTTPTQLAISPNDSSSCTDCYVFVGMGSGGTEIILFNPGNGNPFGGAGRINPLNSSGGANAVAVDPSNRLLYVGESAALASATQSGGLRVFSIVSVGVTELTSAGSPYSVGGAGPSSILPSSDGNYVYVANRSVSGSATGNIASFSVSTTSLTSIGTVLAGPTGLPSMAEDSTGTYLLVADFAGNPDLDIYSMSSGKLTSALTAATGTDPVGATAIAALP